MKFLLFIIGLFTVLAMEARPKDVSLNQDVFVCEDGVRSLSLTEYLLINGRKIVINEKLKTRDDLVSWLNADLNRLTSARARLFNHIARNFGGRISYQKNIQIQRVSFPSQLILPKGCQVQPVAVFTLFVDSFNKPFSAVIDQDLFDQLSAEDQVIVLWEMALDIEQAIFAMDIQRNDLTADFEFNQLRARQFIQCWLDEDCKPKTAVDFHQMAKNLNLDYFEQEEVLIPKKAAVFGKNGLIIHSKRLVSLITRDFKEVFISRTLFRGQIISIPELAGSNFSNAVIFRADGRLQCAGLLHIQQPTGPFAGKWKTVESDTAWPFEFPLCWTENFQLTQGYFAIPWDAKFTFKVQGQTVRIAQDKLGGGKDQGTIVILDQNDRSIKWVNHVMGELLVGVNGQLPIDGYLKLRRDQSVECAQISADKDLKKAGGGVFKYRTGNKTSDFILCFNQKGEYEKSYAMYDFFKFLQGDLVLVGNQ